MSSKATIYVAVTLGSIIGGYIPALWGGGLLSYAGIFWSGVGSVVGLGAGYMIGNRIEKSKSVI